MISFFKIKKSQEILCNPIGIVHFRNGHHIISLLAYPKGTYQELKDCRAKVVKKHLFSCICFGVLFGATVMTGELLLLFPLTLCAIDVPLLFSHELNLEYEMGNFIPPKDMPFDPRDCEHEELKNDTNEWVFAKTCHSSPNQFKIEEIVCVKQ